MKRILVENVNFSYGSEEVLREMNMEIEEGDFVCILGESGCGKSTILKLLAGLGTPDSGDIKMDGEPIKAPGLERGVVFQDYGLYPWMSTGKNILLALQQKHPQKKRQELKREVLYWFEQVGLDASVYDKYPNALSGGMRQRCAICRAFAIDSPILLMDEPFGALDAVTRYRLQDLVKGLCKSKGEAKKTIIFVTHDVEEAMYLANKIFVLGLKPSKVIYSHEFADEDKDKNDRNALFQKEEYIALRGKLMSAWVLIRELGISLDILQQTKDLTQKKVTKRN